MKIYSDFYPKSKIPSKQDFEAMMQESIKKLQKEIKEQRDGQITNQLKSVSI